MFSTLNKNNINMRYTHALVDNELSSLSKIFRIESNINN